ncbi:hypothetical protein D3C71_2132210 [compost metagenome]
MYVCYTSNFFNTYHGFMACFMRKTWCSGNITNGIKPYYVGFTIVINCHKTLRIQFYT